jgi:hypothetical protein
MQVTWTATSQEPDTHGEMGMLGDAIANTALLDDWIGQNAQAIQQVAQTISAGSGTSVQGLVDYVHGLPARIREAVQSTEFVATTLAYRLAEAGILPMFGMPTSVRELYFKLPKGRGDDERDAQSLDRPSDQAIADFAPGSERTWDKRRLSPTYVTGPMFKESSTGQWKASGSPIGAAYLHVRCGACRQLHVEPVPIGELEGFSSDSGLWNPNWLKQPPRGVVCPNCGSQDARPYLAVSPRAFATDMNTGKPALGGGESRGKSGSTEITSPRLAKDQYEQVCNVQITLERQAPVFRTNTNRGDYFGFHQVKSIKEVWQNYPYAEGECIWKSAEENPDFRVALTSPKTTDILAIRMLDGKGLKYFEGPTEAALVRRRAAWYSAATLLQRAIALELDVDSMDIEIASVHALQGKGGGELYLADAHPNGAGLVYSAKADWESILRGCLFAEGPASRMGRTLREELDLANIAGNEWRSPDLLLRGFRNRQIHGLLDWELGIDLLASMLDEGFRPGLDVVAAKKTLPIGREGSWLERAALLVDSYASNGFPVDAQVHEGPVHGWTDKGVLNVVVHPLWDGYAHGRNAIGEAHQLASRMGIEKIRRIDSFNLSRRMAWVRANLANPQVLVLEDVDASGMARNPSPSDAGINGIVSISELAAIPETMVFTAVGRKWKKVAQRKISQLGDGEEWLAAMPMGHLVPVTASFKQGMTIPKLRMKNNSFVASDDATKYLFVAMPAE